MIFNVKSINTVYIAGKEVDGMKRPREPPTGGNKMNKTHIVDYEKIFDVCMNGDDLEFKKGLVRLQKMQNEYVMQREND